MRKKLLALLMCATMVLGSSAVAFAAPSNDDYKNAETILKQFAEDKGNIKGEYDAKKENVSFTTELVKKNPTNSTVNSIRYSYVFDSTDEDSYVKVNSDSKKLQKTDGKGYVATVLDASAAKNKITTTATADELNNSVVKFNNELYYATTTLYKAGETVTAGYAVNQSITLGAALAADTKVVTLEAFDGKATGTITVGKDSDFVDQYGIDVDGYINLARAKSDFKLSQKIADGYWVSVSQADAAAKTDVANALAAGTITKKAAAVNIDLYKTVATDNKNYDANTVQYGFQKLTHVVADVASHDVTFKTDWLSQSAANDANVVYILDKNVPTFTEYFQRIGSIYKVSDLADEKFSTNYLVSGTYIFDVATDASNNDGVSDNTTTAAAAAANNSASPKTGDVAPIAALAVVMMGACGAMVVASKKRA